jgi:hypothetical protein
MRNAGKTLLHGLTAEQIAMLRKKGGKRTRRYRRNQRRASRKSRR